MNDSAWIHPTALGLDITRKTAPNFGSWKGEILGAELERRRSPWLRADLMLAGVWWFGDDQTTSVFDPHSWGEGAIKTWQNALSIGSRIPPTWWNKLVLGTNEPSRRREELYFSTHTEVAYLKPKTFKGTSPNLAKLTPEELQTHYLDLAVENNLSSRALRELINADTGKIIEISFNVGTLDERCGSLAKKVGALIGDIEQDLPMMGSDAAAYLFTAHDALDAAGDELARVLKKAEKRAA